MHFYVKITFWRLIVTLTWAYIAHCLHEIHMYVKLFNNPSINNSYGPDMTTNALLCKITFEGHIWPWLWATDLGLWHDTLSQWDSHWCKKIILKSIHKWQKYNRTQSSDRQMDEQKNGWNYKNYMPPPNFSVIIHNINF